MVEKIFLQKKDRISIIFIKWQLKLLKFLMNLLKNNVKCKNIKCNNWWYKWDQKDFMNQNKTKIKNCVELRFKINQLWKYFLK